jgi:hypothetical protein
MQVRPASYFKRAGTSSFDGSWTIALVALIND